MNIFTFEDYRTYLKDFLALEENQSSGKRKSLLASASMSSSYLTQILAGTKHLSSEQAYEMALDMGLTEKETDYFLVMVEMGRVGTVKLRDRLKIKLRTLQAESKKVAAQVSHKTDRVLTDEEKAIYYSSWIYTAVRNLIPTGHYHSVKDIAAKLDVPEPRIEIVLQFLLDVGLVTKGDSGLKYRPGVTHLDASNPLVFRHHQNWRQRAIQRMDHYNENHLHYTMPMAISKELAKKLRELLLADIKSIHQSMQLVPEVSYCLNIDLFEY
jgi:uncharacterized protein (TIGR02147 family)